MSEAICAYAPQPFFPAPSNGGDNIAILLGAFLWDCHLDIAMLLCLPCFIVVHDERGLSTAYQELGFAIVLYARSTGYSRGFSEDNS